MEIIFCPIIFFKHILGELEKSNILKVMSMSKTMRQKIMFKKLEQKKYIVCKPCALLNLTVWQRYNLEREITSQALLLLCLLHFQSYFHKIFSFLIVSLDVMFLLTFIVNISTENVLKKSQFFYIFLTIDYAW